MDSSDCKSSLLLINCYRSPDDQRIPVYQEWLAGCFEVKTIHLDALSTPEVKEDAAVVSGSERLLSQEPLPAVLKQMLSETTKPLLGVCYGHQALALAWGAKITMKKKREGEDTISLEANRDIFNDMGLFLTVHVSHLEHVVKNSRLLECFDVLAYSDACAVEAIRHKEHPLWGVQFHPERSGLSGKHLVRNFAHIVNPTLVTPLI